MLFLNQKTLKIIVDNLYISTKASFPLFKEIFFIKFVYNKLDVYNSVELNVR
jgi:hypothetical protein